VPVPLFFLFIRISIVRLKTLKELYLRHNQIGDQGAQYFAYALQNNTV